METLVWDHSNSAEPPLLPPARPSLSLPPGQRTKAETRCPALPGTVSRSFTRSFHHSRWALILGGRSAALRRQARTLESSLDSKLTQYSKLASALSSSSSSSRDTNLDDLESGGIAGAEEEVEELIGKVRSSFTPQTLLHAVSLLPQ